ncbi:MAG: PAS domain S-box protein, partial [Ignavibacteria bacterium]|nr:PAS domain S-box protein [Ignavibacteria bacterium]
GPVEQAQVVASTAVIVSMATIIAAMIATGQSPRLMDFISILTVGLIGFTSVYFSLSYSRQLDDQRRELLAINTIAEAVNRVVELDTVLRTALDKATDLLNIRFGWIYMIEGSSPALKSVKGTDADFLALMKSAQESPLEWLSKPRVQHERLQDGYGFIAPELKSLGIQSWGSMPLTVQEITIGALIVGGDNYEMITPKQLELMRAFANQISVAMHNAQLFHQLKQSEHRYADLFEHAPDMYLTVDRSHRIVGCNITGAELLGTAKNTIPGRTFDSLFTPDHQEEVRSRVEKMFVEGLGLKDVEEILQRPDGKTMVVSFNASLVRDAKGTTINARIVARDISERKMMESAILHAQKIDSIGNLAGGIAHDFNNILASILGSASIMRRRLPESTKLDRYLEIIENASRKGSSLTRQMLTFARKTETHVEPITINALVTETVELFQRSVSKEITIEEHLTADSTEVNGDTSQIQQGFLNILLNARDAMPGGGTLTISTITTTADASTISGFSSVKPGPFIEIRVSDTGVGMDKDTQNRIFDPFFSTKDLGTGLGLSVLYGVVQNHGGFIRLESEVGRGTTFSIFLPRVLTKVHAAGHQRRKHLPRGSEHVLVIDDEMSVCEITRDMLSELGYAVSVVHDGKAGVEYYRTRVAAIDLVLLDVNMPVMGGPETFNQLKTLNSRLPIIILTGYGKGVIETSAFDGDRTSFMRKPFPIEELATKVRQTLDSSKEQTQLPA